ncbi:site-specific integrase, partial [Fulvivirga sp. M361]|uniref:site-specific integrase n=1 Tax=Fulvivirga sp. M361 TaxID=2594266 RepID=UPI001C86FD3D
TVVGLGLIVSTFFMKNTTETHFFQLIYYFFNPDRLYRQTLAKLTTEDIGIMSGTIHIKGGRTYNERTLALQAVQIIELDRYMYQTRKELQEAFKQKDSQQLLITGYAEYRDIHKRLVQRLQKQDTQVQSNQQIKASVITHWLKQYNLREVQYMAGHRKIQTTEAYQQNDMEGLQLDIDRLHPLNTLFTRN